MISYRNHARNETRVQEPPWQIIYITHENSTTILFSLSEYNTRRTRENAIKVHNMAKSVATALCPKLIGYLGPDRNANLNDEILFLLLLLLLLLLRMIHKIGKHEVDTGKTKIQISQRAQRSGRINATNRMTNLIWT